MVRRVLICVLLVLAVGVAAVVLEQRSSGSFGELVSTAEDSVLSDATSSHPGLAAARINSSDRGRSSGLHVRITAVPTNAALIVAVILSALLAVSAAAPHRLARRCALVPLRAPPAPPTL